jgi:hypothetical protein
MANPVYGTDFTSLKKQTLQIAPETVAGTPMTSGFFKLHAMSLTPTAQFETEVEPAMGARFNTTQTLKKETAQAAIGGKPDFNEVDFILSSVIRVPDKTGTSPAFSRLYDLENVAPVDEAQKTFTLQYGDANQCETYAGGLVNDYQLQFDREGGVTHSGNILFGAMDLETALVSGASEIAKAPILSRYANIWVADDPANLGNASYKVVLPWNYVWGINGRADEYFALNSAYPSSAMRAEGESQGFAGSLKVPAIYGLPKFITSIRNGQIVFVRVEVTGAQLDDDPVTLQTLRIDQCWFVQNIPTDNYKAVYSKNIELVGAQSNVSGWEKAVEISLINGIA